MLVLDEPTAALPPHEVESLFSLVRQARSDGTSVIYVSHRLNEIFQLAERTTVLRDGVAQGTVNVEDIDHSTLVRMIVGDGPAADEPEAHGARPSVAPVAVAPAATEQVPPCGCEDLIAQRLDGVDFDVALGEIVGVAGLSGSGREELAGALVGERASHVDLEEVDGRTRRNPSPRQAKEPRRRARAAEPGRGGCDHGVHDAREHLPAVADSRLVPRVHQPVGRDAPVEALDLRPRHPPPRPRADLRAA